MIGDLQAIRQQLVEALKRFAETADGLVWEDDLTNAIDPAARSMIVTSLEGKIAALDAWLTGAWTLDEELAAMDFVERWHAEELTIERMRNRYPEQTLTDLANIMLSGRPIPALDIPTRGKAHGR